MKPKKELPMITRLLLFVPVVGIIIAYYHMTETDQLEWCDTDQVLLPIAVVSHWGYYFILAMHFIYVYVAVLPFC